MASISFWNRIEPSPRSDRLERHLAAQIRDPLWFLCRQYQFGEFRGEDAASPAFVEMNGRFSPITGWFAAAEPVRPFENEAPIEELVQTEAFTPNWGLSIELGQEYEDQLLAHGIASEYIDALRAEYAIPAPNLVEAAGRDHDLRRLLLVCQGRGIDGATLLQAIEAAADDVPAKPSVPASVDRSAVGALNRAFEAWIRGTYGEIGTDDAPGWQADRLEYRAHVTATSPGGDALLLDASPNREGGFDWYAFDQRPLDAVVRR